MPRAWTESLVHPGLIGCDFADVMLAPRIGIGELLEWTVILPLPTHVPVPPGPLLRSLAARPHVFVQAAMRMAPTATLAELNALATTIQDLVPDVDVLWTAPFEHPAAATGSMELALLRIESVQCPQYGGRS